MNFIPSIIQKQLFLTCCIVTLSWNGLFAETSLNLEEHPITVWEYCAFLNAVGSTDTHHLYNLKMGSEAAICNLLPVNSPLIIRSGSPGSYCYCVSEGCEELPITYVTYFSAARFCNWLENNQPEGDQDAGTTETGTYTFQEEEIIDLNSHAICSLPSKEQYEQLFKKSLITTDSNKEKISCWTSSLENEDSYSIWNPALVSEQNQQTSSMDPSCAGSTIGFYVITHHDNITAPLPKPSPTASHAKSTLALLKKTGAWTLYSGEFVLFNVAPEIIEVILYEKMKLWFLLPYVGVMGAEISYALLKGDTALATTIALHMAFDISVILADQFFNFDLATKTAELLEQCGLQCVSTFFATIHNRIHDFIEYLGIEHSHGISTTEIDPIIENTSNGIAGTSDVSITPLPLKPKSCCNQPFDILKKPHRHRIQLQPAST